MHVTSARPRRLAPLGVFVTLIALVSAPHAGAHVGEQGSTDPVPSVGLRVDAPADLHQFLPGEHWSGSAAVDNQNAVLVYGGSGCTVASYAGVAADVAGNIALVDSRASETNPADACPSYTFAQKVQAAEQAGAIGLVQIADEGDEAGGGNAVSAAIPAIEIGGFAAAYAVRDAVISGTEVTATIAKPDSRPSVSDLPCLGGMAGPYACDGIDLLSFVPQEAFDGAGVSDIWGWTDPDNGDEYVMLGKTNGTAFFRVTDPKNPVYVGELPNPGLLHATWHDVKVFANHAFIVSESENHGMTVFDLTRLRGVTDARTWDFDARYQLANAAHNIAINTDTGFAYLVGGNAGIVAPDQCLSGLHMIDINDPKNPTFAGCFATDGGPGTAGRTAGPPVQEHSPAAYVHDTQCVVYDGPDTRYAGQELCFNASEDEIVVVDVTDKAAPSLVGRTGYDDVTYAHQGWLTEDHAFLIANDELDEETHGFNTRTLVFDVRDLENPTLLYEHFHDNASVDHNNYVVGDRLFQSNYTSGLRVLDISNVESGMRQVAFFDTFPANDDAVFSGTWSNYPYFASGTIAVTGMDEGLFLVRLTPQDDGTTGDPSTAVTDEPLPATGGGATPLLALAGIVGLAVLRRPWRRDAA